MFFCVRGIIRTGSASKNNLPWPVQDSGWWLLFARQYTWRQFPKGL